MPEVSQIAPTPREQIASVRVARLAEHQWGVVARGQVLGIGVSSTTLSRWLGQGRLHRLYPGVYAVGHGRPPDEGRLVAALLYAGPGAALSHRTAAWWWRLQNNRPATIEVSAGRRVLGRPGLCVHYRPAVAPVRERGLLVTSVARTLHDLATVAAQHELRRAVAEADYRGLLDAGEIEAEFGPGRKGTVSLRWALANHLPQLATTLSALEERFVLLCEAASIRLPEVNVWFRG